MKDRVKINNKNNVQKILIFFFIKSKIKLLIYVNIIKLTKIKIVKKVETIIKFTEWYTSATEGLNNTNINKDKIEDKKNTKKKNIVFLFNFFCFNKKKDKKKIINKINRK